MAKPACTFCEQNEGILMATTLDDGDTQIVCGGCMPAYAIGVATAIIRGMSKQEAGPYADALDALHAADPRGPRQPPPKAGRKPRSKPAAEPPSDAPQSHAGESVALPEPCQVCGSVTATGDAEKLTCDGCGTVIATASESSDQEVSQDA